MSASEEQIVGAVTGAMEDQHEDVDMQQVGEFAKAIIAANQSWPHIGNDNPEYAGWTEEQTKAIDTISQRGVQAEGDNISFEFGYDTSDLRVQDILKVFTVGNVGVTTHKEGEAVYGDDLLAGRSKQAKGGTIHEIPPSWQNEPVITDDLIQNAAKLAFGSDLGKAKEAIRSSIIGQFPTIMKEAIRFN